MDSFCSIRHFFFRFTHSNSHQFIGCCAGFVKVYSQCVCGIDSDLAAGLDLLHYQLHRCLVHCHTASGVRLYKAHTVEEKAGAFLRDTFRVVAHIEAVLILIGIIYKVLTFLGVKAGDITFNYNWNSGICRIILSGAAARMVISILGLFFIVISPYIYVLGFPFAVFIL